MPRTRRSPGAESRAISTPPSDTPSLAAQPDELADELRRIKGDGGDLFTLLMNGTYRLAVPCRECGRFLTSGASKAAGLGPRCAEKAVV
jgi:hypothetical protein